MESMDISDRTMRNLMNSFGISSLGMDTTSKATLDWMKESFSDIWWNKGSKSKINLEKKFNSINFEEDYEIEVLKDNPKDYYRVKSSYEFLVMDFKTGEVLSMGSNGVYEMERLNNLEKSINAITNNEGYSIELVNNNDINTIQALSDADCPQGCVCVNGECVTL